MKYLALVALICDLIAALPMRYAADDLTDQVGLRDVSGTIHDFYFGWSGRFSYGLAKTVSKALPVALPTILVILALWMLIRQPVLVVAYLIAVPNVVQSIYWNAGATGYGLAIIGLVALVCLNLAPVPCVLLAFVTAGLSDTLAVVMPVVLVAWYALERDRRAIYALCGAIVGLAVSLTSPGNAVRMTYFQRADLLTAIPYGLATTGTFAAQVIHAAPVSLLAVAALPACKSPRCPRAMLIVLLTVLAGCFVASLAAYYATGGPLIARAAAIPVGLVIAGLYLVVYWSGWRANRQVANILGGIVLVFGCIQAAGIAHAWLSVHDVNRPDIGLIFP
jgi:hypothetical protein